MEEGLISSFAALLFAAVNVSATLAAAGHAVLTKNDVRAAVGWVGLVLLVPIIGWLIYLMFGINRIERRARELRGAQNNDTGILPSAQSSGLLEAPGRDPRAIEQMVRLVRKVAPSAHLEAGNRVTVLENGDQAYPAMIAAIDGAQRTVALSTYIFNNDKAGLRMLNALERAQRRGVRVRVLIDGVGTWYSHPSMYRLLQDKGIVCARFLYSLLPWRMPYLNMRSHQKVLVADGTVGFTGGMNIAVGNLVAERPRRPIRDYHFKIEGPVVGQLTDTFAHEWSFATGEILAGPDWFPKLEPKGPVVARGLAAGPDSDKNAIRWMLLAAVSQARERIRILTPYFLPDITLRTALELAAMRGVTVDIVMPEKNNLAYVKWAANRQLPELIGAGCQIWMSPGPFDHSKLMTVDGAWTMFGSANWDPRSLRLNFEFNVECYGRELAGEIDRIIDDRIAGARRIGAADMIGRPFAVRLRDAIAWLFSPYL